MQKWMDPHFAIKCVCVSLSLHVDVLVSGIVVAQCFGFEIIGLHMGENKHLPLPQTRTVLVMSFVILFDPLHYIFGCYLQTNVLVTNDTNNSEGKCVN